MELSRTNAVAISQNHGVIAALSKNDFNEIKKALDDLNKNLKADTISITDTRGNVVIRQHKPEKSGNNINLLFEILFCYRYCSHVGLPSSLSNVRCTYYTAIVPQLP